MDGLGEGGEFEKRTPLLTILDTISLGYPRYY
jgi:hypothetical protein